MYNYIHFVFLFICFSCNSQANKYKQVNTNSNINIDSLQKEALGLYQESPPKALPLFKQIAHLSRVNKDYPRAGTASLNIAGIYDEQLQLLDSALVYTKLSLQDWELQKDTLQIANLLKYLGLLEGMQGNFDQGTQLIKKGITLFENKNHQQGVAVSNINLAKLNLKANKLEESEQYFKASKSFWQAHSNLSRIFDNNLIGIQIYRSLNQQDLANALINENNTIRAETEINPYLINKFEALTSNQ